MLPKSLKLVLNTHPRKKLTSAFKLPTEASKLLEVTKYRSSHSYLYNDYYCLQDIADCDANRLLTKFSPYK